MTINIKDIIKKHQLDEAKVKAASAHKYVKDLLKSHGYTHHSSETTTGAHKSWFDGSVHHSPGAHETVAAQLGLKSLHHFPDEYTGHVHGHRVSLHKQGTGVFVATHRTKAYSAGIDEEVEELDEGDFGDRRTHYQAVQTARKHGMRPFDDAESKTAHTTFLDHVNGGNYKTNHKKLAAALGMTKHIHNEDEYHSAKHSLGTNKEGYTYLMTHKTPGVSEDTLDETYDDRPGRVVADQAYKLSHKAEKLNTALAHHLAGLEHEKAALKWEGEGEHKAAKEHSKRAMIHFRAQYRQKE
jgi:hypothetical protein